MTKIAIFAEHHTRAGQQCHNVEITESGIAINPSTEMETDDVTVYDVSEEEIDRIEKLVDRASAGHDVFLLRVANTLRENLS
jgi:hypothetical protein